MQYFTTFLSKRNVPLILKHLPIENEPLLTIENWEIWEEESIYVVYHDGLVRSILDDKFLNRAYYDLVKNYAYPVFTDNVWKPDFLLELGDTLGFEWDENSFDLLYGRSHKKLNENYEKY